MELHSDTSQPGRWVLAPRKGARFLGPRERARARARERRRRILVVLLEAIGLTALIGLFPPLRPMLVVTAVLAFLLLVYLGLVLRYVRRGAQPQARLDPVYPQVVLLPEAAVADRPLAGAVR